MSLPTLYALWAALVILGLLAMCALLSRPRN